MRYQWIFVALALLSGTAVAGCCPCPVPVDDTALGMRSLTTAGVDQPSRGEAIKPAFRMAPTR